VIDQGFGSEALLASYEELARRGQVTQEAAERLLTALDHTGDADLATAGGVVRAFGDALARGPIEVSPAPPDLPALDYVALLSQERARAKEARARALLRG
jgi:hypothetical protein